MHFGGWGCDCTMLNFGQKGVVSDGEVEKPNRLVRNTRGGHGACQPVLRNRFFTNTGGHAHPEARHANAHAQRQDDHARCERRFGQAPNTKIFYARRHGLFFMRRLRHTISLGTGERWASIQVEIQNR